PYGQATSASVALQLVGAFTSPSGAAARADLLGLVKTAIEQMDPLDREVLALRHFEELSNSEVAETLGIEQKAASIRYIRALRRLKEVLAQMPDLAKEARHG
ncbi:MAG: sigma-70 family RNA polymerase sigma factor, partial [Verrucomicrobiota bacterium]